MSHAHPGPLSPSDIQPGNTQPLVVVNNRPSGAEPDEETEGEATADWRPMLEYLNSERGHEVAKRVLGIVEGFQQGFAQRGTTAAKWDRWIQAGIIASVLILVATLAVLGKFTNEIGIVVVSLLGLTLKKAA